MWEEMSCLLCLQAGANQTGFPFLLVIDALNETPGAAGWKQRLSELIAQLKPFPEIKLCVSTRDTFRNVVVDERFPGYAPQHTGFAGEELLAIQAFCEHFQIKSEITPLFTDEMTNPLFLQLACKTVKFKGQSALDLSLPGFVNLFEDYLKLTSTVIRDQFDISDPANLVRTILLAFVDEAVRAGKSNIERGRAIDLMNGVLKDEVQAPKYLDYLAREGLIILSEVDEDISHVRFAFQRYFDLLRALSVIRNCIKEDTSIDLTVLNSYLTGRNNEDRNLLEALAAVLPEKTGFEIVDDSIKIDTAEACRAFIRSIALRSKQSFGFSADRAVLKTLHQEGLWQEVFENLIKVSLVPNHPLNAEYLHSLLNRQTI